MRIIQILNSPNWSASSAYCIQSCFELMKLGHEVLLMTEPGKPLDRVKKLKIPYDDKLRLNHRNPILYMQAMKHMKKVFKSFKPDLISAHVNECAWMPGMVAKFCCPNAVVARVRTDIAPPKRHPINLWVNHKWTDHIICGSQLHKDICCKNLFLPPERLTVIYGSVDSERFRPDSANGSFRCEIGAKEDDFLICLLGRLSPIKGHEYALKTIALLKELPKKIKLLCLGYESERSFAWLKAEAERLGIVDCCIPMGFREDLPSVLASIDLGIITSLGSEANSRATLEYMACGKPVVATRVGVIPELIQEGKTGYLVEPGNAESMAESIKTLVLDPGLCEKMGKVSRQRIEEDFTSQEFGRKIEAVYKKLLLKN